MIAGYNLHHYSRFIMLEKLEGLIERMGRFLFLIDSILKHAVIQ
jgi:hypothetical protein